jgi:hypothetical protein
VRLWGFVIQSNLIRDLFTNKLPIYLAGGYAEDFLLEGKIMSDHHDVDLLVFKENLEQIRTELKKRGFTITEVKQGANGEAICEFKAVKGEFQVDVVFVSVDNEGRYFLDIDNSEGLNSDRFYFEPNTFIQSQKKLNDVEVKTISPLTLIQTREALKQVKHWVREKDQQKIEALKEKFFKDKDFNSELFKPDIVSVHDILLKREVVDILNSIFDKLGRVASGEEIVNIILEQQSIKIRLEKDKKAQEQIKQIRKLPLMNKKEFINEVLVIMELNR